MSVFLNLSPRKKRAQLLDDESVITPKKIRTASLISTSKAITSRTTSSPFLPEHLARIQTIHASLQHALSVALATSAVSPSVDTGRVPNVLNHLTLCTSMGFTVNCDTNDIRRLCWIWEWDAISLPGTKATTTQHLVDDEDNPFVVPDAPANWIRGAMGLIISPTTHFARTEGKRLPVYGIGIEVEMGLGEGKGGGMAAVARWTAEGEVRKRQLESKLRAWIKLNATSTPVPELPLADLPVLPSVAKTTSLTRMFAKSMANPSSSPQRSPSHPGSATRPPKEFAAPFPTTPQTPSTSPSKTARDFFAARSTPPQTPPHQTGHSATTMCQTPTSSRRAALYERIRLKSLTSTPSSSGQDKSDISGTKMTREAMKQLGQEELRRRLLLGRMDDVAATVWALFSSPAQTSSTPMSIARKRRTMETREVVRALVSSATVPISAADAQDSITLLMSICPFFLRPLVIAGEDWVEMPASNPASTCNQFGSATPPSPRRKEESGEEVLNRSPRTVKPERGGLREVRERVRRELEIYD
ncbi:hypothetical protein BU17DRAFT_73431 [Hysterangium stoloniferum]|nr:hypothetical protein BU17DRAFT_73431 [Hysterangium stoloniferum]